MTLFFFQLCEVMLREVNIQSSTNSVLPLWLQQLASARPWAVECAMPSCAAHCLFTLVWSANVVCVVALVVGLWITAHSRVRVAGHQLVAGALWLLHSLYFPMALGALQSYNCEHYTSTEVR